jgi:hypothetical protein
MSDVEKEPLPFGHSQFSGMSREELQLHCERLYSALISVGVAADLASSNGPSAFWGPGGTGGVGLSKYKQAIRLAEGGYCNEDFYRSFYRYADELLFETPPRSTLRWSVCSTCNEVFGYREGMRAPLQEKFTASASRGVNVTACSGPIAGMTWVDNSRNNRCTVCSRFARTHECCESD